MTRQKEQEDWAEKTREEIGKGNQMTALRFQTGWENLRFLASLQGARKEKGRLIEHSTEKSSIPRMWL